MAVDGDRSGKMNLGLSVKFEGRAQKVVDYSRKIDRNWEFSQITVDLIREYKVTCIKLLCARCLIPACVGEIPGGDEEPRKERKWRVTITQMVSAFV
jgi:hypothetical protein